MDQSKKTYLSNPRAKANILSVLFFTYTFGLFRKGFKKTLESSDLYAPLHGDKSELLGDRIERIWNTSFGSKIFPKKPNLRTVLIKTFWKELVWMAIIVLVKDFGLRLVVPFMLGNLLDYFKPNPSVTREDAFKYAGIISVLDISFGILMNQFMVNSFHYGMKIRVACCSLIYRKALKMSSTALGDTASGKIVNLLSNDVSRFDIVIMLIHYMWVGPLLTLVVTGILYHQVGYAGIIGVIPILIICPLQSYAGKLSAIYRKQTAQKTDERIRLTDEVLSGVKVIKMYAWEKPFTKLLGWARKMELKFLTKSSLVRGVYMGFKLITYRSALFCVIITMSLTDQEISGDKIFVFVLFFNILSAIMAVYFVRAISEISEVMVSIQRIEDFLLNEEYEPILAIENGSSPITGTGTGTYPQISENTETVTLKDVEAKWEKTNDKPTLHNITLDIRRGSYYGIIGPVGAGKSSLLQTILGELKTTSGYLKTTGSVSYASQDPWLFTATVRQNITFGLPFDQKRYDEVVKACALTSDFEQLSDGDLTLVSDRGGSLSGGQKARVNLARAVYRNADVYLLDDPLSAVDVHVAKQLMDDCICGFLAGKTRILVTHQIYLLKDADSIVILNEGAIEYKGNFQQIAACDNPYVKGLLSYVNDERKLSSSLSLHRQMSHASQTSQASQNSKLTELDDKEQLAKDSPVLNGISVTSSKEVKINEEESSKGKVKSSLLVAYFTAHRNIVVSALVLFLLVITQVNASGIDYFVSRWTNEEGIKAKRNATSSDESSIFFSKELCIDLYSALLLSLIVIATVRSVLFYKMAMLSSQKLHDNLVANVLSASMRFFDINPIGRILNRFSKDLGAVDEQLPKAILDAAQIILQLIASFILIITVNPILLFLVLLITVLFLFMRHVYLKSSKNIKRLEGIAKGPVFTHMNATLQGLPTIRSHRAQKILREEFDKLQDYHSSAWYMYIVTSAAFGFWSDFISCLFTAVVTFSFLTFSTGSNIGDVGLAITQAVALTGHIQWGMRQSAEITNQLISVERILEYDTISKEIQPKSPKKPPTDWPSTGKISFVDLSLRYFSSGPEILKQFNLVIHPKEKIGVVGRTGAGKSSLISALFRMADVSGVIEIDEINSEELLLQDLRSKISIIPQDPVLFSGTLRYNLDPFEEYSDADLNKALDDVELKDAANLINKLEHRVMDRGSNYSVGQKQLICLARAIVRNNKILVLDEATANVDPQTDVLIQKTIKTKFADCTVITIAHRLNTIMDSDKVLVLDRGSIMEYDHPYSLLQKKSGMFYDMVTDSKNDNSSQLIRIAKASYEQQIAAL